jgi:hypothetical protein
MNNSQSRDTVGGMSEPTTEAWWVRDVDPTVPKPPDGSSGWSGSGTPDGSSGSDRSSGSSGSSAVAAPELAVTTRLTEPAGPPDLVLRPAGAKAIDDPARRRSMVLGAGAGAALLLLLLAAAGWGLTSALRPSPLAPGPAPSARVRTIDPATVTASASSTQHPDGQISYAVANTLDGDPATAWNSDGARDGKGPGITLTYRFARPVDLAGISLLNGYQKVRSRPGRPPLDLYPVNERVHRLRVITDAGAWIWDLADVRTRQAFGAAHGSTRTVRLEVESIYPSSAYPDLALSEVSFAASTPA